MLQRLREWILGLVRDRDLGRRGERIAARYLRRQGLRVLDRNVRVGRGEIDIVARDGDSLVFVEVKSRTVLPGDEWTGLENIDRRKQEALSRASTGYRKSRRLGDAPWRLDAVTVTFSESGRLESVRWYPAVFELEG